MGKMVTLADGEIKTIETIEDALHLVKQYAGQDVAEYIVNYLDDETDDYKEALYDIREHLGDIKEELYALQQKVAYKKLLTLAEFEDICESTRMLDKVSFDKQKSIDNWLIEW